MTNTTCNTWNNLKSNLRQCMGAMNILFDFAAASRKQGDILELCEGIDRAIEAAQAVHDHADDTACAHCPKLQSARSWHGYAATLAHDTREDNPDYSYLMRLAYSHCLRARGLLMDSVGPLARG